MIRELLEDFELNIREKKAVVNIVKLPMIEVNRGQVRQVFLNLISNALKFSKPDVPPVITISQKSAQEINMADEGFCYLSIKDNGIGFDDKYAKEVFTLFQRLHTKDKFEGTGIGLAISKKIIDKHCGQIFAFSNEGIGRNSL